MAKHVLLKYAGNRSFRMLIILVVAARGIGVEQKEGMPDGEIGPTPAELPKHSPNSISIQMPAITVLCLNCIEKGMVMTMESNFVRIE